MREKKINRTVPDSQAISRIIDGYCLMDDEFMTAVFEENKPAVRLVLRIILGKPGLEVTEVNVQKEIENLNGRSLRLDVLARDEDRLYNIEIQRSDAGCIPEHARFHGSVLDATFLEKGSDFEDLPETYVIFITENDVFGKGLALYTVERVMKETGQDFGDRMHIIYVNGRYRGDDEMGRLMRDFSCTNADEMTYNELAERVRYLKENTMSKYGMSRAVEEYGDEREAKGLEKGLAAGRAEGADRMAGLVSVLLKAGRTEDLQKASSDTAYREQLFKEFGIA